MNAMSVLAGFGLPEVVYQVLRIVAAALGAVGGYIVAGPVVGTLVKLAFQRKLPDTAVLVVRIAAAVLVGALIYFYLPLGPGAGGGGSGTGGGTGDGTGSGVPGNRDTGKPGKDKGFTTTGKDVKPPDKDKKEEIRDDVLAIEIIGGNRYKGDERWYYLSSQVKTLDFDELDTFLGKNKGTWKTIYIILTDDSPGPRIDMDGPYERLLDLIRKHKLLYDKKRR
jgi:hypothetical protein